MRALSVGQLLDRLDDRFATLTVGDPTAGGRHQTLRALVEWRHDLCSAEERTMWARASVFAGGFDLEAAEQVCADPDGDPQGLAKGRVLDLVDGLVAKSILIPESAPGRVRYRLLETIAEHGRERLAASGDEARRRDLHAQYFVDFAQAAQRFWSDRQQVWLQRTRTEHANLALAFEHLLSSPDSPPGAALGLATHLRFYWVTDGVPREGRRWLERSLQSAEQTSADAALHAEALWTSAWVTVLQGDYDVAADRLDHADEVAARHALPVATAHTATWRGTLALFTGDLDRALSQFRRAAEMHAAARDVEGSLMTLFQMGVTTSLLGDADAAQAACAAALRLSQEVGESFAGSYAYCVLAHDAWSRGDYEQAERHARHCLRLKYEISDYIGIPLVAEVLCSVAISREDYAAGAHLLGAVAGIWEISGTRFTAFGPQLAEMHHASAARAVQALGQRGLEEAFAVGRALSEDRTRALLLGETTPTDTLDEPDPADELTSRERQVADLIGEGLSNREIAEKLVLSPRTVEGHVQRVLGKLGFRSRVEIGVWAERRR